MGCFNETCRVTNLPIRSGDKVRLFIIAGNLKGSSYCYPTDIFSFFGLPFLTEYDEYGGFDICKDDKESVERVDDIIKHLKKCAVPLNIGDNEYHDIEIIPSQIDYKKMHEAIWEGRLFIKSLFYDKEPDRVFYYPVLESVYQDMMKMTVGYRKHTKESLYKDIKSDIDKTPYAHRFYHLNYISGPQLPVEVKLHDNIPVYTYSEKSLKAVSDLVLFYSVLESTNRMLTFGMTSGQDLNIDELTSLNNIISKHLLGIKKENNIED